MPPTDGSCPLWSWVSVEPPWVISATVRSGQNEIGIHVSEKCAFPVCMSYNVPQLWGTVGEHFCPDWRGVCECLTEPSETGSAAEANKSVELRAFIFLASSLRYTINMQRAQLFICNSCAAVLRWFVLKHPWASLTCNLLTFFKSQLNTCSVMRYKCI